MKINNLKHPVVLFIPEAGIYPFARGLSILGDSVVQDGGQILITYDTGQMFRSPIMPMYHMGVEISPKERLKIKRATDRNIHAVISKYRFSSIRLSDLVDDTMIKNVNSLISKRITNLKEICFRGFPIGKAAEYDFILETKFPYSSNLSTEHRKLYSQYLKNTALALSLTDKICDLYKPSLFVTFNEYAQTQAVRYSAGVHNVRHLALTYPVHMNIDASRFSIWNSGYDYWTYKHCQNWINFNNIPIQDKHVEASWKDSIFRMYSSGSHIFSSRKKSNPSLVFDELALDPERKTIVVYTSSQDERICAQNTMRILGQSDPSRDAFPNQIEWLHTLRAYVAKREDVQIVVRVHPREGSGQLGRDSNHLLQLRREFRKKSPNFIIVWPNDPVSSYDLLELADGCLVSWSLMGQEAARLGIPVLSCVKKMYYPNDGFVQSASTSKEYKVKLEKMLKQRTRWQHLVKAARFYHWRTFMLSLDLGKTVPADFDDHSVWPKATPNMVGVITDILSGKKDLIEYNIEQWRKHLPNNADIQEKIAMKRGIRLFLNKIFYPPRNLGILNRLWRYGWRKITKNSLWVPPDSFKDYHLRYTKDVSRMSEYIQKSKNNSTLRYIVADNSQAILIHNGRVLKRMSPMVIRLAKLHEYA